jgi:hypothetical protein
MPTVEVTFPPDDRPDQLRIHRVFPTGYGDNVVIGMDIKVKGNAGSAGHQQSDRQCYDGKIQNFSWHARFHQLMLNQSNGIGQLEKEVRVACPPACVLACIRISNRRSLFRSRSSKAD